MHIPVCHQVLYFVEVDGLEIPFIAHHRQDWFVPHLKHEHLWRIYDLDEKWQKLSERRYISLTFA
jgi:transcriptional accessory protein Tex/SPT6